LLNGFCDILRIHPEKKRLININFAEKMIKLVSLNIALPEKINLNSESKKKLTGFFKKPVDGKIFLDELGFRGDGVGDPRIHGGKDLAICSYFVDHYPYWLEILQRELKPGAFGENLSMSGINEKKINIGDIFRIGEAEIEVSQPRQPCHKLNKVFDFQAMACKVQKSGFTGCYFRVKKTGWVNPDSIFEKIKEGFGKISIEMVNVLMFKEKQNQDLLKKVACLQALSVDWREKFQKRL
jgi:MOSC domain-containing protein YiiM